jgi:hypothetical protein
MLQDIGNFKIEDSEGVAGFFKEFREYTLGGRIICSNDSRRGLVEVPRKLFTPSK